MSRRPIHTAIDLKRNGQPLPAYLINDIVQAYTSGEIPDYQMSALLMAITCMGMAPDETVSLTRAYVASGERLSWHDLNGRVVDKHSTGGVGDKTTLVVAPLVTSLGVPVAKMSGRGLGFAGGTLDKLESIPNLRVTLEPTEMHKVLKLAGMCIVGQSERLAPSDGAIYTLRDVTGTVESLPLIAASVMSKKIAAGTDGVVLDVKFGRGSFTDSSDEAAELARLMIRIGMDYGLRCHAVLSSMDEPLGWSAGNALEVREAIEVLGGTAVPGLTDLCVTLAAEMLLLAEYESSRDAARAIASDALAVGRGLSTLRTWIAAQGGDPSIVDDPSLLPRAAQVETVVADTSGWVERVDARSVGEIALQLGAGRRSKAQAIDHAVGVTMHVQRGSQVEPGSLLASVHHDGRNVDVADAVRRAVAIGGRRRQWRSPVYRILTPESI